MTSSRATARTLLLLAVAMTAAVVFYEPATKTAYAQAAVSDNFESGGFGDWTTSGQVSIVGSAIDPQTANGMQTVAQGNYSVRVGDEVAWAVAGDQVSSIEREVVVPSGGKPVLQFSYAVVANDPPSHDLVDKPNFRLEITDLTTNETLPVGDFKYSSQTSGDWFLGSSPDGLDISQRSFFAFSGDRWVFIPWKHEKVDLGGRGGHQLRIRFVLSDCNPQGHAAYGYFDNIRIGDEVALPSLPALVNTPIPAGVPIDPGFLASFLRWIEQNKIWPLVACLTPLLLLGLLGLGGRKVVETYRPPLDSRATGRTSPERAVATPTTRRDVPPGADTNMKTPNSTSSGKGSDTKMK